MKNNTKKRLKIAVGKWGSKTKFDRSNWGAIGGDVEAPTLFETLFHYNPDIDFYIVGRSDFSQIDSDLKNRVNKNNNVFDAWEDSTRWSKNNRHHPSLEHHIYYLEEWYDNSGITFDGGIFIAGPAGTSNVFGRTYTMTGERKPAKGLEMLARYTSPVFAFLNNTMIPYVLIVNDPRYFPTVGIDLFNQPKAVLSQYDEIAHQRVRKDYESRDVTTHQIKCEYGAAETIFLIDQQKQKDQESDSSDLDSFFSVEENEEESTAKEPVEKDIHFMVVCNEGRPSRYNQLKHFILDHIEDVDIYGKWTDEIIESDKRFKGPRNFDDLQGMLQRVKYTFCIPIKKGWATSKFWEMVQFDVIPFVESSYDEQNNIGFPEILRISSSKDLQKKIQFFEDNPDQYEKLLKHLKTLLREEFYNGSFLNTKIMNKLGEIITK